MVSTPYSSSSHCDQHQHSSDMFAKHHTRRRECETTLLRTCHSHKAAHIFIAPWSSASSSLLRPSLCWLSSLLCTSKVAICFILIFSHLVISTSHAEKIKNRQNNSPALPGNRPVANEHGIYFNDNNNFGGNTDVNSNKPKSNSQFLRKAFSTVEGSGSGSNNPNIDDEDEDDEEIESGSGRIPDDSMGKTSTTTSTLSTTTTTEAIATTPEPSTSTTTTTTVSSTTTTTTTTTTPAPSSSTTQQACRDDDEDCDIEGSGDREGSGDIAPEPPKVIPSEPSSTTIDSNLIGFATSSITPSTTSTTTTARSTTASTTTEADYPEPDPDPPVSTNGSIDQPIYPDIDDTFPENEPTPPIDEPNRKQSNLPPFFGRPGILAAIIGGTVVGLLCAIILVMFIVYRMRKKDEGSYPLEAHTFRGNKVKECRYA